MEKHPHPFDDFLKEALKGHQLSPTEKAKRAFLEEASAITPSRRSWKYWYFLPVIFIFLGGVVAIMLRNPGSETLSTISTENIHQNTEVSSTIGLTEKSIKDSIPIDYKSKNNFSDSGNLNYSVNDNQPTINVNQLSENNKITLQAETSSSRISSIKEPDVIANESDNIADEPQAYQSKVFVQDDSLRTDEFPGNDTVRQIQPPAEDNPVENLKQKQSWNIAGSVYYLPELMFNTLEGNKCVHNTGIEAIFYHGLVSIRTGVGISVSKGITTNSVEYNDYLGTYNKLDSITFSFNQNLNNFEPKVYTSSEKVWDSVQKSDSADIIKRYTYLQIPLVLGFDFWQKGRFSVGVRVGTIMSVMLKSHQLTGAYDPGQNLVIGISQLTPSQVSVNWQAVGGISASAVLSKRIGIEIEPQAKYYYGSVYEKSGNVQKPWSIGIRAAVVYKF